MWFTINIFEKSFFVISNIFSLFYFYFLMWKVTPGSEFILSVLCVLVTQSCLTLCDPMDSSLPGSFVHGILQERILE